MIAKIASFHSPAIANRMPVSPEQSAAAVIALGRTARRLSPRPAVRDWLTFHTGARFVGAQEAAFAIGTWAALAPVDRFAIGTPEYPDRAATLIVETDVLKAEGSRLRGPGIDGQALLTLPETAAFVANRALFPLGFDTLLTCDAQLAGVPRSTIVGDA